MKIKYPYTGVIPSSVIRDESLQLSWMRTVTMEMMGVSGYSRAREGGYLTYSGAFSYIDSAFSLVPILYDHYESLPDVYFTYLMEAKETLFSNPPEMRGDVERRIECLNKMLLVLQLAIENNHPNKAKLIDDTVTLRKEINLNIYGAVKMRDKAYLSIICQKHAVRIRNDIVSKKFTQLADKYQKEDLAENPRHHAKNKSPKKESSTHSRRYHSSSSTHFKSQSPRSDSETNMPLLLK